MNGEFGSVLGRLWDEIIGSEPSYIVFIFIERLTINRLVPLYQRWSYKCSCSGGISHDTCFYDDIHRIRIPWEAIGCFVTW